MIVYRCDKCGAEGELVDMRGLVGFSFGNYCASVESYIKINNQWVSPSKNDEHHLCKKCVLEIVMQGKSE